MINTTNVFYVNFVKQLPKWLSFVRIFSQIWLQKIYECQKKFEYPFIFFATFLNHVFRNVKIISQKNQIIGIEKLRNYFIVAFIIINYLFGEILLMKKGSMLQKFMRMQILHNHFSNLGLFIILKSTQRNFLVYLDCTFYQ